MRKTLLIAAAALAASVISSQAQVYSQNIVGYVNTPFGTGFEAVGNPMQNSDGTNGLFNVLPNIPDLSLVYIWNGANFNGYLTYQGQAYDTTGNNLLPTPTVGVGTGLFVLASAAFTNTFVGTVLVTNGAPGTISTNIVNFPASFDFVNTRIPIGGGLISSLQMGNIPDLSLVYFWNDVVQSFSGALSYQGTWYDVTGNYNVPEPTVAAGQAFYILPSAPFTWTVTYTNN